jgi:hypothetical protein
MFVNGFISTYSPLCVTEFLNFIDPEAKYKKNLLKQPYYWEYRNKTIIYKYNSNGHRSCEIDELSNDYNLFCGCSITEGIGLKEEDCYTYLVSKNLNKKFYNLGVGGSSPAVAVKNIIIFLSKVKNNLPSSIIIQWPHFYRYFIINGYHHNHFTPSDQTDPLYKALLLNQDAFRYNMMDRLYLLHFLSTLEYKGKVIEIYSEKQNEWELLTSHDHVSNFTNSGSIAIPQTIDKARDLSHPGSKTHESYAAAILNFF